MYQLQSFGRQLGPQFTMYRAGGGKVMESESAGDCSDDSLQSACAEDGLDTPFTPYTIDEDDKCIPRPKLFVCDYLNCGKRFNRPVRLAEHIRSHTNERPFVCNWDGCEKAFLRETHLKAHVKSVHTQIRDYVCDYARCGKSFMTGTKLRKHIAGHEQKQKYCCTEYPPCNEQFRKHSTLQKHVTAVHLGQKPYQCHHVDGVTGQRCTQGYDVQISLEAHMGRVHGGVTHWCVLCNPNVNPSDNAFPGRAGFSTYALLQEHILEAHPPTCPHCGTRFSSQRALKRHIEVHHEGQHVDDRRSFYCTFAGCDRSFTRKGNLDQHIRTVHEGKKQFVCGHTGLQSSRDSPISAWDGGNGCGRSFTTKGNLEEHIRTQHLGFESALKRRKRCDMRASNARIVNDSNRHSDASKGENSNTNETCKNVTTMTLLTGDDYGPASGRTIACLFPSSCAYLFHREYDLIVHLKARHKMEERHIRYALAERDAGVGGRFWLGGVDVQPRNLKQGFALEQIEIDTNRRNQQQRWENDAEKIAKEGGKFWVRGDATQDDRHDENTDWAEMLRLVKAGKGQPKKQPKKRKRTEEEELIDPLLRYLQQESI